MSINRTIVSVWVLLLSAAGCSSDKPDAPGGAPAGGASAGGASAGGASTGGGLGGGAGSVEQPGSSPTYYDDIAPIVQEHCLQCHQAGGIAPFRLDDYQLAKTNAAAMAADTAARLMPPWSATSDGSCGEFAGSLALSQAQIDTISNWAKGGAKEGTPHALTVPPLPSLGAGTPYQSPKFTPIIQGGPLTESDEYRCFELDSGVAAQRFITGYDVTPGNSQIIHHVLAFVIDPSAKTELGAEPNLTNGELMARLHAQTPDREGWSCFGMAGDGVSVKAVPVIWAPGQGPVEFPVKSGVPLKPSDKIVIQIHYNMHDMSLVGQSDQTTVKLKLADQVERVGLFVLNDPFLSSLGDATPAQLAPGKPSVKYTWSQKLSDFGLDQVPRSAAERRHAAHAPARPEVSTASHHGQCELLCRGRAELGLSLATHVFLRQARRRSDTHSGFNVTCDYDTTSVTAPVQPGWGTSNEMCLATLYFTAPISVLQSP